MQIYKHTKKKRQLESQQMEYKHTLRNYNHICKTDDG